MQIVINKAYFDNIKIAIDAMNNFFASGFKTKDFPVVNNDFQLDRILSRTLSWLNNIEPSWVDDPNKAIETLDTLKSIVSKETVKEAVEEVPPDPENPWVRIISGEDKTASDMFHAFIGFKVLQYITNNFDKYEQLMNGIYSFELFTKPSSYRDAITVFTSPIPMPELDSIAKLPGEYKLFDASDYVNSIFANEQIKLPEDMNSDTEIQRFQSFGDLQDCEIVINDAVQEAAKVDYFTEAVEGIRFYKGKWKISKQFESSINELLKRLRECETTEDLAELFQTAKINLYPREMIYPFREYEFRGHKFYSFNDIVGFCLTRYGEGCLKHYDGEKYIDYFPKKKRKSLHVRRFHLPKEKEN